MILFLLKTTTDIYSVFFFMIPFSLLLAAKGVEGIVRRKSVLAVWFVAICTLLAFLAVAYFIFFINDIPFRAFNFTLPFGALAMWNLSGEYGAPSLYHKAFLLILGIFCNAAAIGCLIQFAEKLYRLNQEINKLDD